MEVPLFVLVAGHLIIVSTYIEWYYRKDSNLSKKTHSVYGPPSRKLQCHPPLFLLVYNALPIVILFDELILLSH